MAFRSAVRSIKRLGVDDYDEESKWRGVSSILMKRAIGIGYIAEDLLAV
jgi:hypothetical protein